MIIQRLLIITIENLMEQKVKLLDQVRPFEKISGRRERVEMAIRFPSGKISPTLREDGKPRRHHISETTIQKAVGREQSNKPKSANTETLTLSATALLLNFLANRYDIRTV
jgi:hypothetical protein